MYHISVDITTEVVLIRSLFSISFFHVMPGMGATKEQAKEEFQEMKMTVNSSFKGKGYLGLWEVMMTKEPYYSHYALDSSIFSI